MKLTGVLDLPRVVWVLAAGRLVGSATSFLVLFLTLYLTGPRALPTATAGLVAGGFGAGLLLGSLTGGRWGDRLGHRTALLWTSTAGGVLIALVPWLPLPALVATLPVAAYLTATAAVSTGALTALAVPRGDRRRAVALGRAASNAGFVVGPPLGALLVATSWPAVFVVDGVALLAVRWAVSAFVPPVAPAGRAPTGLWAALRADRGLQLLLPCVVAVDLVYRQLYTTLPLHLRDAGRPVSLYTALVAVGSGLILLLELPVTVRLRHRAAYPVVAVGYGLVGLGFLLFGLPVTVVSALAAMVVVTAGEILYKTTATAHVLDAAPDHLVGQYQGLYTAAATSGTLLSAPVGAAVYAAAPALLWPLCAVVCGLAAAGVLRAGRGPTMHRRPTRVRTRG